MGHFRFTLSLEVIEMSKKLLCGKQLSSCCSAQQLIVQSRDGGLVSQDCVQCGQSRWIKKWELPTPLCWHCRRSLLTVTFLGRDYAYHCEKCQSVYRVWDLVPTWNEHFGYCGLAMPSEYR
jgi:hypothetical protein